MTVDKFLEKYNHCPFCRSYDFQGDLCRGCKWQFANGQYAKDTDLDKFDPKEEWAIRLNREVTA